MLSHSSSNASDRLRRAKSISSAHSAASSSHRAGMTTSDPYLIRQTAETAASEAYKRAQPMEKTTYPGYRPAPPRLERRKSQVTGRSEGSFLEDARLGRRRSAPKRDGTSIKRPSTSQVGQEIRSTPLPLMEGEVIVTRKRSVIPPSPAVTTYSQTRSEALATGRHDRKAAPAFQSGSPAPGARLRLPTPAAAAAPSQTNASHTRTPQYTDKSYDAGISVTYSAPQTYAIRTSSTPKSVGPRPPTRELQTDEDIVAMARDRCFQDFHQQHRAVKQRKSLFFGSLQKLQKRNVTDMQRTSGLNYDSAIPPFNYADDSLIVPLPPADDPKTTEITHDVVTDGTRKTRMFSGSMKGRFKKLLRKASRAPSGLPAQHVPAKHLHDSIIEFDSPSTLPSQDSAGDPFTTNTRPPALPDRLPPSRPIDSDHGNRAFSGESGTAKSRVTSWTNSTVTGAASVLAEQDNVFQADEYGRLKRSDSMATLRKKSSFFGRTIQNKLRKPSRAELRSLDESHALFTALQERIQPAGHVREDAQRASSGTSEAVPFPDFTREDLPSQSGAGSAVAPPSLRTHSSTIRTVSPEPDAGKLKMMSPVVEASPDHSNESDLADRTPTQPRRRPSNRRPSFARPAPAPTQEQLTRRMQLSQNRWQGPLDAMSPSADRPLSTVYGQENPYELSSFNRNVHLDVQKDTGGLPQHARIADRTNVKREKLLSPSVYSRATDGASPRPMTPEEAGGTVITVTGREIRSYSISPPKRQSAPAERQVQGSGAWRKWLSDETQGFSGLAAGHDLTLPGNIFGQSIAQLNGRSSDSERASIAAQSSSQRPDSATPPLGIMPKERRPRATSRRLSYMNERYPMVDSSRNSSRQSGRTNRKFSGASAQETDAVHSTIPAGSETSQPSAESSQILSKRHSSARLGRGTMRSSTAEPAASERFAMSGALPNDTQPTTLPAKAPEIPAKSANRAKSAFDLRANYRHNSQTISRPLEVRRKTTTPGINKNAMLDDNTLRNISAGPYANKENITPSVDGEGLPALSSSEWLAGPTSRKRNSAQAGRYVAAKEGSPGQRMVTGWLERRERGSGSPAFV